jgi:hypothetical protein
MERHETKDIARRQIQHIDFRPWRNPLWHGGVSDGAEKTFLHELLQLLLGHERVAPGLHPQSRGNHEMGGGIER